MCFLHFISGVGHRSHTRISYDSLRIACDRLSQGIFSLMRNSPLVAHHFQVDQADSTVTCVTFRVKNVSSLIACKCCIIFKPRMTQRIMLGDDVNVGELLISAWDIFGFSYDAIKPALRV